jgi:hypothetical protein
MWFLCVASNKVGNVSEITQFYVSGEFVLTVAEYQSAIPGASSTEEALIVFTFIAASVALKQMV